MKNISLILFLFFATSSIAQVKTGHLKQFNNFSSQFEVPEGQTWVIEQIFSSFAADITTGENGESEIVPIRIFIKTFNGDIKTDWEGNRYGPQVYQSNNSNSTVAYPLTLPEGTKISFVILKGDPGNCKAFDGSAYLSYYEIKND
jgi:hypothetical protein